MVQSCFRKQDISYIFDQCTLPMKLFPVLNIFVWKILLSLIVLNKKVVVVNRDIFESSSCFYIPLFARPSQEGGAKGRYLFVSLLGI